MTEEMQSGAKTGQQEALDAAVAADERIAPVPESPQPASGPGTPPESPQPASRPGTPPERFELKPGPVAAAERGEKAKDAKTNQPEEASQSPFSVTVGQVYDGPLDLLLDLIRKQNIDIYDIPIALLTAQFLDYCHQLKQTDVDAAGEFIYMASLLIHIKSKMLLPRDPAGPDEIGRAHV